MPEISIIIPVYKVEKYLCRCVDSILNQSYSDYEIILVDDGSPDRCPEICDEYAKKDSRIKVIHQKNSGVSAARNKGIEASSGRYLWFIDSDDYIIDNAFDVICQFIKMDFDVLSTGKVPNVEYASEIGSINQKKYVLLNSDKEKELFLSKIHGKNLLPYSWEKIFKASLIKDNNLKFDTALNYGEDSVFNYEALFLSDKIIFSEEIIYVYFQRDDAASKTIGKNFTLDFVKVLEHNCVNREKIINKYSSDYKKECIEDESRFVLEKLFCIIILNRLYRSGAQKKYKLFKHIASMDFIRNCFTKFDINIMKSNSLDWCMLWAVKHRLYFAGHLICKYILFK
ncbi:MAG: glycosyltransferase [Clostridia bacterium]|nr:glycosyltransferase [Clostridia bacterium]